MNTYRIWFDNDAAVLENAESEDIAIGQAYANATAAGYAGLTVVRVEQL